MCLHKRIVLLYLFASYHAVGIDPLANQCLVATPSDQPQVYSLGCAPVCFVGQPFCRCPGDGGNGTGGETLPLKRVEYLGHMGNGESKFHVILVRKFLTLRLLQVQPAIENNWNGLGTVSNGVYLPRPWADFSFFKARHVHRKKERQSQFGVGKISSRAWRKRIGWYSTQNS